MRGELVLELLEARDVLPTEVRGGQFVVFCRVCIKEPLRRRFKRGRDLPVRGASFKLGERLVLDDVHEEATVVIDLFAREPSAGRDKSGDELLGKALLPVRAERERERSDAGEEWLELISGELKVRRVFTPYEEEDDEDDEEEAPRSLATRPPVAASAARPQLSSGPAASSIKPLGLASAGLGADSAPRVNAAGKSVGGPPSAADREASFVAIVRALSASAEWQAEVEPVVAECARAFAPERSGAAAERAQRQAHAAFQEATEGALQAAIDAEGADSEAFLMQLLASSDHPPPAGLSGSEERTLRLLWCMDDPAAFAAYVRTQRAAEQPAEEEEEEDGLDNGVDPAAARDMLGLGIALGLATGELAVDGHGRLARPTTSASASPSASPSPREGKVDEGLRFEELATVDVDAAVEEPGAARSPGGRSRLAAGASGAASAAAAVPKLVVGGGAQEADEADEAAAAQRDKPSGGSAGAAGGSGGARGSARPASAFADAAEELESEEDEVEEELLDGSEDKEEEDKEEEDKEKGKEEEGKGGKEEEDREEEGKEKGKEEEDREEEEQYDDDCENDDDDEPKAAAPPAAPAGAAAAAPEPPPAKQPPQGEDDEDDEVLSELGARTDDDDDEMPGLGSTAAKPRQPQPQPATAAPTEPTSADDGQPRAGGGDSPADARTRVRGLEDETIVRFDGELNGAHVECEDLNNCTVLLLDVTSQVTIDRCTNCRFLVAPTNGSVFVRDCISCMFTIACRQLRTRACTHCDIFVHTLGPIVESSSGIRFERWNVWYPGQAAHFARAQLDPATNKWAEVYDFTPADDPHAEPHWSLMPPDEFLRWEVRFAGPHAGRLGSGELENAAEAALPAEYSHAELEEMEVEPPAHSPFGAERKPVGKRLVDGQWVLVYEQGEMDAKPARAQAAAADDAPHAAALGAAERAYERQLERVGAEDGWRRTVAEFGAKHSAAFDGEGAADRARQQALHELYAAAAETQLEETLDELRIEAEPFLQQMLAAAERAASYSSAARAALLQVRAMEDFGSFVELMQGAASGGQDSDFDDIADQ